MIIQCSICKRIRKFGDWIQLSNAFVNGVLPKDVPVEYMLCDTCKGINGGCDGLRKAKKEIAGCYIYTTIVVLLLCGLVLFLDWLKWIF